MLAKRFGSSHTIFIGYIVVTIYSGVDINLHRNFSLSDVAGSHICAGHQVLPKPNGRIIPIRLLNAGAFMMIGGRVSASAPPSVHIGRMSQTSIERLRDYLAQLPPQSQALLMREFERAIERGEDTTVASFVLEQLRKILRGTDEEGHPPTEHPAP